MIKKFRWTLYISTLALTLGLVGCSAASSSPSQEGIESSGAVTLRFMWWGSDQRKESTQKVIDLYESKHPNVQIEAVPVADTSAVETQWAIEHAEQQAADIIQADYAFIFNFSDRNLVEPLQPFIDQKIIDVSAIDPSALTPGTKSENLYAFPISQNNQALLYNPQMLEAANIQPPTSNYTLEQFEEILRAVKAQHPEPDFAPLANMIDVNYYLRSQGAQMYSDDGSTLGYTDDQILADYFALNKKWLDEGLVLSKTSTRIDENHPIVAQKAAFISFSSNNIVGISKLAQFPVNLIRYPSVGEKDGHWVKPSMFLAISSYSKHKQAAAEFLNFFINDEEANAILNAERGVPVSSTIAKQLAANDPLVNEQVQFMDNIKQTAEPLDPPNPSTHVVVSGLYQLMLEQVLSGAITPEQGAAGYRERAEEVMTNTVGGSKG